ncbi:methionine--tRNA ligase [Candidatus Zinderia endosymbiont of Aphrophora alni]|uniref:methionine--tRNA ligase n=1 Tax=Candidatus Zinderia endosymbiont of Aphrophora alni TaxID=3077951 RepID=UPI0030D25A7A
MNINNLKTRKIFVTTALPYANGKLHIGHIMEFIQADIWVRFQRMQKNIEVYFIGADDTHGVPVMLEAKKKKKKIEEFIYNINIERKKLLKKFYISFDNYYITDSIENHILSKKIYLYLRDKSKMISFKKVEQFFDLKKKIFLSDRYIKGTCPKCDALNQNSDFCEICGSVYSLMELKNPYSIFSNKKIIKKKSDHIFFLLSKKKCINFLSKWIFKKPKFQTEVINKAKEWLLKNNLKDWDISRDYPYFGIKIPDTLNKYFYVWLDAPIAYISSLKNFLDRKNINYNFFLKDKYTEQYHFIGKDIIYFHILFWPAILKFSKNKLPTNIFVHGFITINGKKLSKSNNYRICPLKYLNLGFNPEWLRYYIAYKLNSKIKDIDLNIDDFIYRINSDLIGKYINIPSRISKFICNNFNYKLNTNWGVKYYYLLRNIKGIFNNIYKFYEERNFKKVLYFIMKIINKINIYINFNKPWNFFKKDKNLQKICSYLLECFRIITIYLKPILPLLSIKIEKFLNINFLSWLDIKKTLPNNHSINYYKHLLKKVDLNIKEKLFKNFY